MDWWLGDCFRFDTNLTMNVHVNIYMGVKKFIHLWIDDVEFRESLVSFKAVLEIWIDEHN